MTDETNLDIIALVIAATYVLAAFHVVLAIQSSRTPQGATAWSIGLISIPFLAAAVCHDAGPADF